MVEAVRYGLVGYGSGGRIFHAPLIASTADIDFVGVVTRSPQRRAELPEDLRAFDSLSDITEAGVQAVTISTPAATHAELAHEAIRLGLAVVVDKPFALTADSAREVAVAAGEAGVLLSVYQNRRWDSDFRTARR
jgi:predicted dehydrogenase